MGKGGGEKVDCFSILVALFPRRERKKRKSVFHPRGRRPRKTKPLALGEKRALSFSLWEFFSASSSAGLSEEGREALDRARSGERERAIHPTKIRFFLLLLTFFSLKKNKTRLLFHHRRPPLSRPAGTLTSRAGARWPEGDGSG